MNITEFAETMDVTRQTIYDWIKDGKLKARKDFTGRNYIPKSEVTRLVNIKRGEKDSKVI